MFPISEDGEWGGWGRRMLCETDLGTRTQQVQPLCEFGDLHHGPVRRALRVRGSVPTTPPPLHPASPTLGHQGWTWHPPLKIYSFHLLWGTTPIPETRIFNCNYFVYLFWWVRHFKHRPWLLPWAAQRRCGCRRWRPWSWWGWCAFSSPCAWMWAPCWARRGSRRTTSTTSPCGCPAGSPSALRTGPAAARWPPVRQTRTMMMMVLEVLKSAACCSLTGVWALKRQHWGLQADNDIHIEMEVWCTDNKGSLQTVYCWTSSVLWVKKYIKHHPGECQMLITL